jgi:hypothetical protein
MLECRAAPERKSLSSAVKNAQSSSTATATYTASQNEIWYSSDNASAAGIRVRVSTRIGAVRSRSSNACFAIVFESSLRRTFLDNKLANSTRRRSGAINWTSPAVRRSKRSRAAARSGSGSAHFAATLQSTTKRRGGTSVLVPATANQRGTVFHRRQAGREPVEFRAQPPEFYAPVRVGGFRFQKLNDFGVQASALSLRFLLDRFVNRVRNVLDRDVHATILEPLQARCNSAFVRQPN